MNDANLGPTLGRIAEALERLSPTKSTDTDLKAADAFVWHAESGRLDPALKVNRLDLQLLKGIDRQTDVLLENTVRFANGLPANNALLWGARGTGKSSLVKAVQLYPRHPRAWYNLGLAHNGMNQPEAAIAALLKAESVAPNDPEPPYARATILYGLRRIPEAVEAAQRALEIQPGYTPARTFLQELGL